MLSLIREFFHFIIFSLVLTVMFVFTNCGEEGVQLESQFESENYVYIKYRDGDGVVQSKKSYFSETHGHLYIDGDVIIGRPEDIGIGDEIEMNVAVHPLQIEQVEGAKSFHALKSNRAKLWSQGKVPFSIDESISLQNERILLDLIFELNELLSDRDINLQLVRRTYEKDYINFIEMGLEFPMGGQSYVGRVGGKQALKLREDNFNRTIIHHEILHALGFKHEHQRSDRTLKINYNNIVPNLKYNFSTYIAGTGIGDYDFKSIMHYHSYAFSKNGKATMETLEGDLILRNRKLSEGDIEAIGEVYGYATPIQDGSYVYNDRYFLVVNGYFCEHRYKNAEASYTEVGRAEVSTFYKQGLMAGLLDKPYCGAQ